MQPAEILQLLPVDFAKVISGYQFRPIHRGMSPAKVFRLKASNRLNLYLKTSSRVPGFSLFGEKQKLEWLAGRLPVPKVLQFATLENADYLLLTEISGLPASDDSLKTNIPGIIEQLVSGLKMIHSVSNKDCPFDTGTETVIELALERINKGMVDESDFDEERLGKNVEDLAHQLLATKPVREDLVFTHGDYCLPNIILENGNLSGFVDWGKAGVADRYQDLALLTRSVGHNFGDEWKKHVFKFYGIEPDWEKIRFFQLLDEFF